MNIMRKMQLVFPELVMPYVSARQKKPLPQQAKELYASAVKYRMFPYHYFRLALYKDGITQDVLSFVPSSIMQKARARLNARDSTVTDDKIAFSRQMIRHGLPVPETLCVIRGRDHVADIHGHPLSRQEAADRIRAAGNGVFVKTAAGASGKGARLFSPDDDLSELMDGPAYLVQERLRQHTDLSAFNPDTLNTIRIDTFRHEGTTSMSGAYLRVGRKDGVVDNFSAGGIVIGIDLETGRLGRYGRQKPRFSTQIFERHPETGVPFAGVTIPFWEEVKSTAVHGAEALGRFASIGWDIAVTPNGTVIVEANANWEISTTQMVQPLADSRLARTALAMRGTAAD